MSWRRKNRWQAKKNEPTGVVDKHCQSRAEREFHYNSVGRPKLTKKKKKKNHEWQKKQRTKQNALQTKSNYGIPCFSVAKLSRVRAASFHAHFPGRRSTVVACIARSTTLLRYSASVPGRYYRCVRSVVGSGVRRPGGGGDATARFSSSLITSRVAGFPLPGAPPTAPRRDEPSTFDRAHVFAEATRPASYSPLFNVNTLL